jgi:hypothetical protein
MAMRWTTGEEVAAFVLARAISIAAFYVANWLFFATLYVQLYRSGGMAAAMAAGLAFGLVGWLLTLLLLVLFRAGFGGVPPTVAADTGAVTTSPAELGAFLLSYMGVTAIVSLFNVWVTPGIYGWMRANGHTGSIILVSLGIAAVSAIMFFPMFIALRGAMAGSTPPGDAVGSGRI